MKLEWIDDILAVLDNGSLARAAEKRLLTQSAFTRRVRLIEDNIGTTLFDRRRKPVTLMPGVQALEPELRDLSNRLHKIRQTLKTSSDQVGKSLAFICQHALTATISPQIVRVLTADSETSVRVRSGNQDECLMQLLSKEVDFAIMYAIPDTAPPEPGNGFEAVTVGEDVLIPVCAPVVRPCLARGALPMISYPSDVFLGQVVDRTIIPRLSDAISVQPVAETALTLAMLQLVLSEIGVAWLPQSLVVEHLAQGRLVRADAELPSQALNVRMIRLSEKHAEHGDRMWRCLAEQLSDVSASE
ncbi:LysR family transcriptional regulator [Aliiroseovarius sp. 2305UL8-7]|uniref:LysR family transcriptional regulator n=1 Tax=Aliiroseovarius conchicola TaxID=3121637 RepID=UPI003526D60B